MSDFTHLHCHTEYSLLDGAIRLKDLCKRASGFGMKACAITDHGNMFGVAHFYSICREHEIKPILGCEVYTCKNHKDKSAETGRAYNHLILLAQNDTGYHNLIKLVSHSFTEGFYYKPRVDKHLLHKYGEGIICLSACLSGEIPAALLSEDMEKAIAVSREYSSIFPGRFYLELQSNGLKEQRMVNQGLLELAEIEKLPLVATNDCHYLTKDDAYAHEVLVCIQTQKTIDDPSRMKFETDELYFKSGEEMETAFSEVPQAIANTAEIASMCNVELDFGHHYFPVYPLADGESPESEFRRLAREGLAKRLKKHPERDKIDPEIYRKRLEYELDVIVEMGFPGYFLIVQEFINWAKDHGIPVGPGRGSAAGSLVAWALRITNLDPLPYNLLFERFLNIERISLPDIDVDFCERRRIEVIRHMADTYGKDSVAQITTFGTMKAKGVVRDVGRALGMSLAATDRIARLIPESPKMTIDLAMKQEPDLKRLYDEDSNVRHLIETAKRLEGLTRHASTHAAGLVVSDKPMVEYLPLYADKNDKIVTQFDGPMTEKTGLVKFDFLGLKTMTQIYDTLDNIRKQGKEVPDLDALPLDDQATYDLYSRGDTDGVFQVESSGMRQYLRMLKPGCFEDIIAMLALYRPGPLGSGMVDEFIKRKHGQMKVVYPHESLKDCLADTYGVIVYQEQVMQIAQIIASYTLGGADLLRRAMGKKKPEIIAKERAPFVEKAGKNNIPAKKANEIFDLMEKFAFYGFNKSHSAAYALISYQTAWLKTHYKVEFMASLLTSEMGNQDKLLKYVTSCRDMDIEVLQPSINDSSWNFEAKGDKVLFGLGGIKGLGKDAVDEIMEERKKGPYTSLHDLCYRVNSRRLNKRNLEALIKGGAVDCLGASRAAQLACMEIVLARAQKKVKSQSGTQFSFLSAIEKSASSPPNGVGIDIQEANLSEMPEDQKLKFEKEALGFFLTSHPLEPYRRELSRLGTTPLDMCSGLPDGSTVNCAVLVTNVKEVITKSKGERMAFVSLEDLTGHAEITFFPKDYVQARNLIQSEQPLFITAKIKLEKASSANDNDETEDTETKFETKLFGSSCRLLSEACAENFRPVIIRIPQNKINRNDLEQLRTLLENHPGNVPVTAILNLPDMECYMTMPKKLHVRPGVDLETDLKSWAS